MLHVRRRVVHHEVVGSVCLIYGRERRLEHPGLKGDDQLRFRRFPRHYERPPQSKHPEQQLPVQRGSSGGRPRRATSPGHAPDTGRPATTARCSAAAAAVVVAAVVIIPGGPAAPVATASRKPASRPRRPLQCATAPVCVCHATARDRGGRTRPRLGQGLGLLPLGGRRRGVQGAQRRRPAAGARAARCIVVGWFGGRRPCSRGGYRLPAAPVGRRGPRRHQVRGVLGDAVMDSSRGEAGSAGAAGDVVTETSQQRAVGVVAHRKNAAKVTLLLVGPRCNLSGDTLYGAEASSLLAVFEIAVS
ncbi:hypothetical protein GGR56DRAFT_654223 [Xylariaceae sp. FL0804]|nr:hypothetical protein GGR56DRAFT_654223 [Xylariaceae sp. FL0804]